MQITGERFHVNLDDSDDETRSTAPTVSPFDLVGEVKERNGLDKAPSTPSPPSHKNAGAGFPAHRKRAFMSRFKAQKQDASTAPAKFTSPPVLTEREQIDLENRDRLSHMSEMDIAEMKQELMASFNPKTLAKLLAKSYIDEPSQPTDFPGLEALGDKAPKKEDKGNRCSQEPTAVKDRTHKKVSFATHPSHEERPATIEQSMTTEEERIGDNPPGPESQFTSPDAPSIHWPKPSQPPSLDPSAPSFLDDLHNKYFPDLPTEPEKLEWMRDTPATSTYKTDAAGLDPKDIRFSFAGTLIPPKLAAEIPVTAGLHHHGDAPDAAGYTIAELGILARSTVAAQRCMAFQTLGRFLYRLGKGGFGDPSEDTPGVDRADQMGELARGLWDEVQMHAILDICVNESEGHGPGKGRHASARAYATEAVWLWHKGGGRRWTAA